MLDVEDESVFREMFGSEDLRKALQTPLLLNLK